MSCSLSFGKLIIWRTSAAAIAACGNKQETAKKIKTLEHPGTRNQSRVVAIKKRKLIQLVKLANDQHRQFQGLLIVQTRIYD